MLDQLFGVFLVWLTNLLGNLTYLSSSDAVNISDRSISHRLIGIILILISTIGLGWQSFLVYNKDSESRRLRQVIVDTNSHLFNEASGGVAIEDVAYIVDDEKPRLFKLRLVDDVYQYVDEIKLREGDNVLTADDVADLEAAAILPGDQYDGKIYLITSHSNTKKGAEKNERWKLLQVSLELGKEGQVTRSMSKLREPILSELKTLGVEPFKNQDGNAEVIQIEGLAIDPDGYAYLGMRAPLAEGKYGIVLRAKLADLFEDKPAFKPYKLNLTNSGKNYGIASLDYDAQTKKMLVLGSNPNGTETFIPTVWQWDYAGPASNDAIQIPKRIGTVQIQTKTLIGQPELLLLPPASISDQLFMFLDTDDEADGGQISIKRRDWGLAVGASSPQ